MTEQMSLIPENPFVFQDRQVELVSIEEYPDPVIAPSFQKSIEQYGVMEPIIVYKSGRGDGMYRIADGRRRALAAFRAGHTTVPAMVVSGGDDSEQDFHKITLIANTQRGVNALSEYQAIMELLKFGKTEKQIAAETGMTVSTIKKRLKLNALPDAVMEKVREGVLSVGAAEEAVKLSKSQMNNLVALLNDEENERVTHVQVKELRDVDRTEAADGLPDQLFMDEVSLTFEEMFEADLRTLTNRFDFIPASEMARIMQEMIARITTGK